MTDNKGEGLPTQILFEKLGPSVELNAMRFKAVKISKLTGVHINTITKIKKIGL
jgi:hypothetical protein